MGEGEKQTTSRSQNSDGSVADICGNHNTYIQEHVYVHLRCRNNIVNTYIYYTGCTCISVEGM